MNKELANHPASFVCHWSSGPVFACADHAEQIVGLGRFMGLHVAVTPAEPGHECANCINAFAATPDTGREGE